MKLFSETKKIRKMFGHCPGTDVDDGPRPVVLFSPKYPSVHSKKCLFSFCNFMSLQDQNIPSMCVFFLKTKLPATRPLFLQVRVSIAHVASSFSTSRSYIRDSCTQFFPASGGAGGVRDSSARYTAVNPCNFGIPANSSTSVADSQQ